MKDKKNISKRIGLIAFLLIAVFIAEEFVRTMLTGLYLLPPPMPHYEGLEYYEDESYKKFKRGEEASLYLPKYDEIKNAEYIDFLYIDQSLAETIFSNFSHVIALGVRYEDDAYFAEKDKLLQQGTEIRGANYISEACLLNTVKKGLKLRMYYLVLFSDEYHTAVYVIYYDDILLEDTYTLFNQSPIEYMPFMRDLFYNHIFFAD